MRIHDYLAYWAREEPDLEFAVFEGRSLTYGEAEALANRIARAFVARGLAKGDRVAVLSKNSIEMALLFYGAFKAGVILVPLNYRLAGPEWAYIIGDSGARGLIARGELVAAVDAVRDDLELEHWIALDADHDGWTPWDGWLEEAEPSAELPTIDDDDIAYFMYTSGTTGRPKGAVLNHRAVCSNLVQWELQLHWQAGDRYLIVAPLYHAAAAISVFVIASVAGSVFIQEDFVPADTVRALSEDRIVGATLVPAMIQACLVMVPDVAERDYERLRLIGYGASPIAEATLRRAMEVFGRQFLQGYGMTETTAVVTVLTPADHRRALAGDGHLLLSAGRAVMGTEIRIVDGDDHEVPHGEIGEIAARGPQLMNGYWKLEEASSEALRGGWMHTGDAGIMDEEGFVYVQDRVKDMVISGGENVYPREVEDALFQHPAVADVAVIGVPDEKWGEAVKAVVVFKEGQAVEADELLAFCRERLAGYKTPRSIDVVAELPRNASGKVLKKDLRAPYWEGHERQVS